MTEFERNLRAQLRATEHHLDQDTAQALRQARARALAGAAPRLPRVLLPLGGMTLASIAVFFLVVSPLPRVADQSRESRAAETAEMQDLDFYYWLAETQDVSDS